MKMDVFALVRYYLVIGSYTHATITLLPILITFAVKCCMHVKYKVSIEKVSLTCRNSNSSS